VHAGCEQGRYLVVALAGILMVWNSQFHVIRASLYQT
jgi:hypothetical protein